MAENPEKRPSATPTGKRQLTGDSSISTESYESKKVAKVENPDEDKLGGGPAQFVPEVATEMRKVVWPTGQQMLNYTLIVFAFLIVLTALVWSVDTGSAWVIEKILVPESAMNPVELPDPGAPAPEIEMPAEAPAEAPAGEAPAEAPAE
ncbi:preprotein translocase subunit SecE [Corynebacterium aquatimens]|uniref:Protein translocase subunit SecE n=1 Tax=Corynebacterium aquatimens TaxID=1190508 RepID=A0A931GRW2_9CORY|nr:preprotein translocase subunit SecE [Corynebacterium aquatimens]WJY65047.1 preprotein translocase subunit SecE [Corynebacterium aquatimens]